jgi:hypothetical protein
LRLRIAEWRQPSEGAIAFRLWTATLYPPVEIAVGRSFGEPQGVWRNWFAAVKISRIEDGGSNSTLSHNSFPCLVRLDTSEPSWDKNQPFTA